jgi:23S rRNA (uracil1939-C5)-methyltransferase
MKKGDTVRLNIESIDLQANGVARHESKVVFVRGALPGEQVLAQIVRVKPKFNVAQTVQIERESSLRVRPRCPHFGVCGGCSMQHLAASAQLAIKQRVLEDQFTHLAGIRPEHLLRPIAGPDWRYRYRARIAVRDVFKKGTVLVGFHEKGSGYVADMTECHVMPERLSDLLVPLRRFIESLDARQRVPQIEVAVGAKPDLEAGAITDESGLIIALVFRVLDTPTDADLQKYRDLARQHQLQIWLQPKGPDTIYPLNPDDAQLNYSLPEFQLDMPFLPTDFTQVNHRINAALVGQALRLLEPKPNERIADLFCGLGNFSLPIAQRGAQVIGLEGAASLCKRAAQAASQNGLAERTKFAPQDLFKITNEQWLALGPLDGALIDPPREGAAQVVQAIAETGATPARIVYVSCNPATLARDTAVLVNQAGYRLRAAGVVNMFPHTSHVESIAHFVHSG